MSRKRLLAGFTAAALLFGAAGTTLAYLTDTDEETNTFTVGKIDIDLIESQYHRVNAGRGSTADLTEDDEPLSGGYLWAAGVTMEGDDSNTSGIANGTETEWNGEWFSDEQIKEDAEHYKDEGGYFETHAENMVPGSNVRKNPYIVNTGDNDAYVRLRALVPVSLFAVLDNGASYWTSTALNEGEMTSKAVDYYMANGYTLSDDYVTERDGIRYYEIDFTYTDPLAPGEMTFWNAWGNIAIDRNATNSQLAGVESFDVLFEADAIQAKGFASAADAFRVFDEEGYADHSDVKA